MPKYLITGGAGFIGSALAKSLINLGNKVRVFDNLSSGKLENLNGVLKKIDLVKGDIRDMAAVRRACIGIDYVLHHAAVTSVQGSIIDPMSTSEVNILGTSNILAASKDARVMRLVFASSASVYGNTSKIPIKEGQSLNPISPYAASKLAGEFYCRVFYKTFGLETVVLRYFNVFGPRQDPSSQYASVIPIFIKSLIKGNPPTIYGDGEQTRDFINVEDVVRANISAATSKNKDVVGNVFNIASGHSLSINKMLDTANEIMGKNIAPQYAKARTGDIKRSLADSSKAAKILKFKPRVPFKEGLKTTIQWYRK